MNHKIPNQRFHSVARSLVVKLALRELVAMVAYRLRLEVTPSHVWQFLRDFEAHEVGASQRHRIVV